MREAEGLAGGRQRGEALTSAVAGGAEGARRRGRPPWPGQIRDPPRAVAPGPPRAPLLPASPYPETWTPAPCSGHPRGSPGGDPGTSSPPSSVGEPSFYKGAREVRFGEDADWPRLGCCGACGICALSAAFSQNRTRAQPGVVGSGSKGSSTGSPGGDRGGWRARKPPPPSASQSHFPVPGRSGPHRRPPARPRRAHVSFSPPFFAVVIEDDRIDDVLKNMTDKAPPGV